MVELTILEEQEIRSRVGMKWGEKHRNDPFLSRAMADHQCLMEVRRKMDVLLGQKVEAEERAEQAARWLAERPEREERLRVKRLCLRGQRRRFLSSSC